MEQNTIAEKSINKVEVIPSGKLKCYITGELRKDTPEERIRQDVARSLIDVYNYNKEDIDVEFSIKMGRARKRADIVIFANGGGQIVPKKIFPPL